MNQKLDHNEHLTVDVGMDVWKMHTFLIIFFYLFAVFVLLSHTKN